MADNNMFGQVGQQVVPQQYQMPQAYGANVVNPYGTQQWQPNYWNVQQPQQPQQMIPQQVQMPQQTQQQQNAQTNKQDVAQEYILLDGSASNKKRKYVFVGEVDMQTNAIQPLPSFSLEDVRQIVAHEFDVRFGEEKKK